MRFSRRIPSFGGDLGLLSGNLRYFSRRIPLARADFWGIDRVIEAPFCEAIPPERDLFEAVSEGDLGQKMQQKRTVATMYYSPFRVSLYARHYARLRKDVIKFTSPQAA